MSRAVTPVTLVKRRAKALQTHLPAALAGDARALHRARVASRRLREVFPLAAATDAKTSRRVRRLTQWLGRVREMDVALALLDEDGENGRVSSAAIAEARRHLHGTRERRQAHLLRRIRRLSIKKLDRDLAAFVEACEGEDLRAWTRALSGRLARRARAFDRVTSEAGAVYVPERLHAVRIAAKKLRYALEIAAELGTPYAAKLAAIVRRVQVTLGNHQDRHVLLREVRVAAPDAPDAATRQGIATFCGELEQCCREIHADYLRQRETLGAALAAVRRDVIPALARASRRPPLRATTHGQSDRAVPDSTRRRRGARGRVA